MLLVLSLLLLLLLLLLVGIEELLEVDVGGDASCPVSVTNVIILVCG